MTNPSPSPLGMFEDPIAGGLTEVVFSIATKVGGAFIETIKDKRQAKAALDRYEAKYRQRYGSVRILGMRQDYPLEQVYTKVKFLDDISIRRFESISALEEAYRDAAKRRFTARQSKPQGGSAVVNQHPRLTVLGQPGAGKSTFLRRVGLAAFGGQQNNKLKFDCIPVFLELKRFNPTQIDLLGAVAKELANFGFPETPEFAAKALEQGKLLVLLDGLDEVPREILNPAIEAIQDFVTRYDKNRFITSCRTAAHRSDFRGFTNVELADFDDEQIQAFIHNWFQTPLDQESNTAQRCWEQLNDGRNQAAKELAQTPLLLTFLCLVYDKTQKFPDNRANLYRKALDILLEEWAADKRLKTSDIYEGLNTELEKVMLAEIAYKGFIDDQLFFTKKELIDQINEFAENTANKPSMPGKNILNAIAQQQGIFVERAEDVYSFSHLTLQEYLTAQHISQDFELIENTISKNLTDPKWREVFLLVSGLLGKSDKYLGLIMDSVQKRLTHNKLIKFIHWIERKSFNYKDKSEDKSLASRIALTAFFLDLEYALNFDQKRLPLTPSIRSTDIGYSLLEMLDSDFSEAFEYILSGHPIELNVMNNFSFSTLVLELIDIKYRGPDVQDVLEEFEEEISDLFELQGVRDDSELEILKSYLVEMVEESVYVIDESEIDDFINGSEVRRKFSLNEKIRFSDDLRITYKSRFNKWLKKIGLEKRLLILTSSEAVALENYLYGIELVLSCKLASTRVSAIAWASIKKRMLTLQAK